MFTGFGKPDSEGTLKCVVSELRNPLATSEHFSQGNCSVPLDFLRRVYQNDIYPEGDIDHRLGCVSTSLVIRCGIISFAGLPERSLKIPSAALDHAYDNLLRQSQVNGKIPSHNESFNTRSTPSNPGPLYQAILEDI